MPHFNSLNKLVKFFDTHDMGEYLDQMPEVHFDVDIKKRSHLSVLDNKVADKLTELAKLKHILSAVLINSWLRDKILSQAYKV